MKIRQGFVSNSSSTSFCIMGVELTPDIEDKFYETENYRQSVIQTYSGEDGQYIGVDIFNMRCDETLKSFSERVNMIFKDFGIDIDSELFVDGGYNG